MKKILILSILIIFISGCSGEYNLKIEEDKLTENIDVILTEEDLNRNVVYPESYYPPWKILEKSYYALKLSNGYEELYTKNITDFNNGKKVTLSYVYTLDNFNNSNLMYSCFDSYVYKNEKDFLLINASKMVDCIYTEPLKINISTDLKVLENNADNVNKNTYTWILTEENSSSKNIMIKISKEEILNNIKRQKYITYTIVFVILLSSIIFLLIRKSKKSNEIW